MLKYAGIVAVTVFLFVLYVWQSVEVMKLKLDYDRAVREQKKLILANDRLIFEIEKSRSPRRLRNFVESAGYKRANAADYYLVEINEN